MQSWYAAPTRLPERCSTGIRATAHPLRWSSRTASRQSLAQWVCSTPVRFLHRSTRANPVDRLARIIGLTGASLVVTDAGHVDLARAGCRQPTRPFELADVPSADDTPVAVDFDAATPGLLLFTSGSTGVPKGVLDAHMNIVPNALMFGRRGQFVAGDRVALTTSFGFTATYTRLFGALVNGATACPYDLRQSGVRALPAVGGQARDHDALPRPLDVAGTDRDGTDDDDELRPARRPSRESRSTGATWHAARGTSDLRRCS